MDYLAELTFDDLDDEQRELAELVGLESYKKLIKTYGGINVYILKEATVCKELRNRNMRNLFDGDYKKLAREFKLSIRQTREIIDSN